MKKLFTTLAVVALTLISTACTDANVASRNLSKAADTFQLERRIVFYNGITGDYILSIQGACSVETYNGQLSVTCKTGQSFKKHYLGLSDNVTYFSEQLSGIGVSTSHYKVIFKPSVIVPDVDLH